MKRLVKVFVEGIELELFNDETIEVTSSVQNISDISKVFTDFSQSFTVPATPHNNQIFEHFYQSDVQASVDHNVRRDAFIEIDLTSFRRGKIQLEKSNLKNGQVESYTITFYGDILSLKDKFKEDKLFNLDLSSLEFEFNATEVYNRITDLTTDYDVRYPLIANSRLWTYHHGGEDITTTSKAINYDELFPAVKISKIFEAIETTYGITFQGTFLSDPRFTNCFLWAKNTIEYNWVSESQNIVLDAIISQYGNVQIFGGIDVTTDSIDIVNNDLTGFWNATHNIQVYLSSKSANGTVYLDIYQGGNLWQTLQRDSVGFFNTAIIQDVAGCDTNITFKIRTTAQMTVDFIVGYEYKFVLGSTLVNFIQSASVDIVVINGNVNLNNVMPDMKVEDFLRGVLLEFNMTCVGIEQDVYEVLPLDDWYSQGAIVDITQYTNTDSIDIERIKLYKKIAFKYQDSESFANKNYFKTYNKQYGNLEYQYNYDGDEYTIESPYENLLFVESVDNAGDSAILGYALDENYSPYTPKPILMYLYGESDTLVHNIRFYTGAGHSNISSYALFGQDLTYQNTKYSLNFGADNSIIHQETIQQGLYASYYFPYLTNLYNLKNRLVYVNTILPISLLTSLRLNDRLIIRDKRYIINEMKSNLTSGEVNFSLYLDFRPLIAQDIIKPTKAEQCLDIKIQMPNGAIEAEITTTFPGVTITPDTITSSSSIEVCIPENTNSPSLLLAENNDFLTTEDILFFETENSTQQVIILTVTYTFSNGSQASNQITIIQQ